MKKITKYKNTEYTVLFIQEEEGGYTAIAEEVPGAISYGETLEEARENIHEAIEMVLDAYKEQAKTLAKKQKTRWFEEQVVFA